MNKVNQEISHTIIKPTKGWASLNFKAVWEFHELLYFLAWRNIKVRYKQSLLGASWAIFKPLLTMIIFTIFFSKVAKIPSEGIPYPIFSYSGLLLWIYFSGAVTASTGSLVSNVGLITKVYFPKLIMPLSSAITGLIDYLIAMSLLIAMMFFYHITPGLSLLLLPLLIICAFLSATGIGFWLSALNVKYRDIGYITPFFIQLLLFATPVIYPTSFIPEKFQWLLLLNPISGVIEAHRASILAHQPINWFSLGISVGMTLLLVISGAFYFRQMERTYADII